jgi:hypothetical protein
MVVSLCEGQAVEIAKVGRERSEIPDLKTRRKIACECHRLVKTRQTQVLK